MKPVTILFLRTGNNSVCSLRAKENIVYIIPPIHSSKILATLSATCERENILHKMYVSKSPWSTRILYRVISRYLKLGGGGRGINKCLRGGVNVRKSPIYMFIEKI